MGDDSDHTQILRDLRDLLETQKRHDVGGALDRIRDHMLQHDAEDKERHAELRGDIRGLSLRVGSLEKDVEDLEDQADVTGRHNIVALQDEAKWWKRGILGSIGAAILAFGIWLAQRGIK